MRDSCADAVLAERRAGIERVNLFRRLWDGSVALPTGCRIWQGECLPSGYGKIVFDGATWLTHRAMFLCTRGELPEEIHVLHHCSNPQCIEPKCLFSGTGSESALKSLQEGRKATKVTADIVRAMRLDFDSGAMSIADLMRAYGLTRKPTHYIVHRKSWKHVT